MPTEPEQIKVFNDKHWISKSEAARLRGVSRQAIWELVKRGRLVPAAYGRRMYLRRSDVLNFERGKKGRRDPAAAADVIEKLKGKRLDPAKWFTITQASQELDVTHQVIAALVRRGRLRALASEGKTFVLRSTIEKFKTERPAPDPSFFPKPERKARHKEKK
jgi:IS30 family transposase